MLKYFLRLFGSGRLPEDGQRFAAEERCLLLSEAIVGSMTFRNYRAPGKRAAWKRRWFLGSILVTERRVAAYWHQSRIVNIPFSDNRISAVQCIAEQSDVIAMKFDASLFRASTSGEIEIRFHTPEAQALCSLIASRVRVLTPA
jgi:hypothetical protein